MNELTLKQAEQILETRLKARAPSQPIRTTPVIVHGPEGGYIVVELGFAEANGLARA